jgi:hypothetical protein
LNWIAVPIKPDRQLQITWDLKMPQLNCVVWNTDGILEFLLLSILAV